MAEAKLMREARESLRLNTNKEVKDQIIFQKPFLNAFAYFRDECLWNVDFDVSNGRGPGVSTTATRVAIEYPKGMRSKFFGGLNVGLDTSKWSASDYYEYFIFSVLVDSERIGAPLLESTAMEEVTRVAGGLHRVLQATISWYNPTRQSTMAQQIQSRLPQSRHIAASNKLSAKGASSVESCYYYILDEDQIAEEFPDSDEYLAALDIQGAPSHDAGTDAMILKVLEGETPEERQESLEGLVSELAPQERKHYKDLQVLFRSSTATRIAISRSDTALSEAGARQQRLILAQNFEHEVAEDVHGDRTKDTLLSYVKVSDEEQAYQDRTLRYIEGHASTGTSINAAKKQLGINPFDPFPRIPGMRFASSRSLKDYQVDGIAWLVRQATSGIKGCILADAMGLGKTCQAICAMFVVAEQRQEGDDKRPSLIVCPAELIQEWEREIKVLLPSYYKVVVYDSSFKDNLHQNHPVLLQNNRGPATVVLTSYGILHRRHGLTRYSKDPAKPPTFPEWSLCLQDKFSMMILDEAHNIKSGKDSLVWRTLSGLNAASVVALTGTPIPNVPVDVIGLITLVVRQASLQTLHYQATSNPYNLPEGHPNALLQCYVNAIHDWIKNEKDPRLQGGRLKKLFRHCLLSRRYTTVVNGRVIGADLPPIKIETVVLRGTPSQDKQIGDIMKELKDRLLKAVRSGSSMAFVPKVVRTASQASFWFPFARMENWDGCKTIREIRKDLAGVSNAAQLKKVMIYIHNKDQTILGFDPTAVDGLDLVEKVIEQSPKMQWALHDAAIMVLALQKKIVLWVNWPWVQLLTEVVLKASGFSASSYHAGLSRGDRSDLVKNFNEDPDFSILICSYDIGSEGLNLHTMCADVRCLQPATTLARENQAIFRIRRIAQRREQSCSRVQLKRCLDFSLLFFNLRKEFPAIYSFINEKRESEVAGEDNERDMTIDDQAQRTVLYQKLMVGLQNGPAEFEQSEENSDRAHKRPRIDESSGQAEQDARDGSTRNIEKQVERLRDEVSEESLTEEGPRVFALRSCHSALTDMRGEDHDE
ncbi:hypothetical protein SLS55_000272 [Diplodia seriata]|uniref:Helicase ATP-binding domain-containing protein n=1 Tax=Diplodia seriata TaxID=420778 RepID=A0ABR3CTT2_9PEZI